ncbi:MAG: NAD(P)-dependent oxidoreductase [Candidatus Heimdallarchaeota archaeon]
MKQKVGWIGTGVMGKSMCRHILNAGYEVSIYNRTKKKSEDLVKIGAIWRPNAKEVAENSDIIFTIVGYPKDVEEIFFGEQGIMEGIKPNSIIVDMTTSEPTLAQRIYQQIQMKESFFIDAPVSGGDIGAREGTLAIMAGGDKEIYEKVLPFFNLMGKNVAYMGKAGAGQHTKMSNQILIASTMIGVVESLLYAYKAGNDLIKVINVIGKGAAGCWSINNLGPRIVKENFDPGFFIKHFVKDMGIALQEAKQMNLALPGLALAYQFYVSAIAMGLENLGTQGLYKVFAKMNGIET